VLRPAAPLSLRVLVTPAMRYLVTASVVACPSPSTVATTLLGTHTIARPGVLTAPIFTQS
jgi:hypothetical protein